MGDIPDEGIETTPKKRKRCENQDDSSSGEEEDSPSRLREKCSKISNYSSLITLREIWSVMSKDEIALIRKTAIGHLVDMPETQSWSGAIFCYLMSRQILVEPNKKQKGEVWFKVKREHLCFRKEDFAVISGLSFRELSNMNNFSSGGVSKLREKHFLGCKKTKGKDLYDFLIFKTAPIDLESRRELKPIVTKKRGDRGKKYIGVEPIPCEAEDRVKVALLYVVHMFLLGHQDKSNIDADLWHLVENISDFNSYAWGERSYRATFEKTHSAIDFQSQKLNCENATAAIEPVIKPQGMPQVLVVWFLALFPVVLSEFGQKIVINGWRPLILRVVTKDVVIKHNTLAAAVKVSGSSKEIMQECHDAEQLSVLGFPEEPLGDKLLEEEDVHDEAFATKPLLDPNNASKQRGDFENKKCENKGLLEFPIVMQKEGRAAVSCPHLNVGSSGEIGQFPNIMLATFVNQLGNLKHTLEDMFEQFGGQNKNTLMQIIVDQQAKIVSLEHTIVSLQKTMGAPTESGGSDAENISITVRPEFVCATTTRDQDNEGPSKKSDLNQPDMAVEVHREGGDIVVSTLNKQVDCPDAFECDTNINEQIRQDANAPITPDLNASKFGRKNRLPDRLKSPITTTPVMSTRGMLNRARRSMQVASEKAGEKGQNKDVKETGWKDEKAGSESDTSELIVRKSGRRKTLADGLKSPITTTAVMTTRGMLNRPRSVAVDIEKAGGKGDNKVVKKAAKKNGTAGKKEKSEDERIICYLKPEFGERRKKKVKFLYEVKIPKIKIDNFINFNFKRGSLVTREDVDRLNDCIHKGETPKTSLLDVDGYKVLLAEKGMLDQFHINGMLRLFRESTLSTNGKWTTIDSLFQTYVGKSGKEDKIQNYRDGKLPKGAARPWKYVEKVYGVVHIPKLKHWVAICISLKEQTIHVYDSRRPKPNCSTDKIHTEITSIKEELRERTMRGEWFAEYVEKCPQQDTRSLSCGVYALKFVECLIRGIDLSRISECRIHQYRREMAIQLYKQQYMEL